MPLNPLHIVDNPGGEAVDKNKKAKPHSYVSPYLQTRLRSFDEALRAQERARLRGGKLAERYALLEDSQAESAGPETNWPQP